MRRRGLLTFTLGLAGIALDGLSLAKHLVLGTEPAWVARVRELTGDALDVETPWTFDERRVVA